MIFELHHKRDALQEVRVETKWGHSVYQRLGPGERAFTVSNTSAGFLLNNSPEHQVAFGEDEPAPSPLEAGMGWVMPAGTKGRARWAGDIDMIIVRFADAAMSHVNGGEVPDIPAVHQVSDPAFVHMAISLQQTAADENGVTKMYRETVMLALAAHVNRMFGESKFESFDDVIDPRLRRALDLIEEKLETDVSIAELAAAAAMSPFHFARSFKRATGMAPHQFLAARRVERAKLLLKTTTLPTVEVAFRVGYRNVSHFTQRFKRVTGGTPAEFRAR